MFYYIENTSLKEKPILTNYYFLGYAIIQIPDFLASVYTCIEKWIRSRRSLRISDDKNNLSDSIVSLQRSSLGISDDENNLPESLISLRSVTKTHVVTGSKIPRLVRHNENQNISQKPTFTINDTIAELREETNIKMQKIEKMLEENNRKLEELHTLVIR